jgi:serine/threonine protein kinase
MITEAGVVKLLDFGLAKGLGASFPAGDKPPTVEGKFAGTVAYVSPEQAEGKPVDFRSDIFSFGSVLFEMLTSRRAFPGDSTVSVLADILRTTPPSTIEIHPQIDARLDEIVQRCLRKDRARRFQSIGEVGIRLRELEEEIQYAKQDRRTTRPGTSAKAVERIWGRPFYAAVLGAVVTAALATGLFFATRKGETPTQDDNIVLTRATSDAGLSEFPALSSDGKFLAYASDRSGTGNLDIWLQQLKDGELHQRTLGPDDNYEPVFSPDGTKLAFRSNRNGGGLYLMSPLGGDERPIASKG